MNVAVANRNADVNDPARIRAAVLAAMFEHSQIDRRGGFESTRKREAIHREIDELLDEWATSRLLLALEHISNDPQSPDRV